MVAPLANPTDFRKSGDSNNVDESWMLPILYDLGGQPVVTKEGFIAYVFPDLETARVQHCEPPAPGSVMEEKLEAYIGNSVGQNMWALTLGAAIHSMSSTLWTLSHSTPQVLKPDVVSMVR